MKERKFGSDLMTDVLRSFEIPYITLNPGASFRGLHDSLVNWKDGGPPLICCQHEKVAIGVAHGYAKATGRPLAVALHDLVGLLQATMGIYYAFHDRVPMLVLGGSGPADTARRRPSIDWYHSANVQGNAVREYVKWDDEPRSLESMPEALIRAWNIARSGPAGPVYVSLDADLQEQSLAVDIDVPDPQRFALSAPTGADLTALRQLAEALMAAERPVIVAGFAGRDENAFALIPRLAELTAGAVIDIGARLNMPNRHPLNLTGTDVIGEADLVVFLDCKDAETAVSSVDAATREVTSRLAPGARCMALGFGHIGIRGWSHDYGRLLPLELDVVADTVSALPELVELCAEMQSTAAPEAEARREERRKALAARHETQQAAWRDQAQAVADDVPLSTARLAQEVWNVVKHHDWVLTAGTSRGWAKRLWDFDKPYRHPGDSLGTATQIGISLGVALAHKGTGRLVVDLQPDGDLMFDLGTLWVAAYYEIPMLVVMVNNRAYYNDWAHQEHMALQRGRPVENAYIGMEIDAPPPDFASIARGQGWYAEGPFDQPDDVGEAIARVAEHIMKTGKPALVDVITQHQ